jgi:hypothetical protein
VWKVVSTHRYSGVTLGDTSRDGLLDETDAKVIATKFNLHAPTVGQGDANTDGIVDLRDFAMLASNVNVGLGGVGLTTAAPVPEPASGVLLLMGVAVTMIRRRA